MFIVVLTSLCPNRSWISLILAPDSKSKLAWVCRNPCKVILGKLYFLRMLYNQSFGA